MPFNLKAETFKDKDFQLEYNKIQQEIMDIQAKLKEIKQDGIEERDALDIDLDEDEPDFFDKKQKEIADLEQQKLELICQHIIHDLRKLKAKIIPSWGGEYTKMSLPSDLKLPPYNPLIQNNKQAAKKREADMKHAADIANRRKILKNYLDQVIPQGLQPNELQALEAARRHGSEQVPESNPFWEEVINKELITVKVRDIDKKKIQESGFEIKDENQNESATRSRSNSIAPEKIREKAPQAGHARQFSTDQKDRTPASLDRQSNLKTGK